jgi:hypothetical protein
MIATAWNKGAHHRSGAGYGLKLAVADRDRFFRKKWKNVILQLEGVADPVFVNIDKKSFWGSRCRELIDDQIGRWLIDNKKAPWPHRSPPKVRIEPIMGNLFSARFES